MNKKSKKKDRKPTTENGKQKMYGFEKLIVWQKAMEFCEHVYKATENFPREELFGLTSQLRRASYSIPLNIAEGSASKSKKEFKYFLTIALRSQYECITLLKLSLRLNFLSKDDYSELFKKCDEIGRLLNALIKSQSRRQQMVTNDQKTRDRQLITGNREPKTEN